MVLEVFGVMQLLRYVGILRNSEMYYFYHHLPCIPFLLTSLPIWKRSSVAIPWLLVNLNVFPSQKHVTTFLKNLQGLLPGLLPAPRFNPKFLTRACGRCTPAGHLPLQPWHPPHPCTKAWPLSLPFTHRATNTRSFTSLCFCLHCFLSWEHSSTLSPSSYSAQSITPSANFL